MASNPHVNVKRVTNTAPLYAGLERLKKAQVLVGITTDTAYHNVEHPNINNAELLFIQSHGSPARGIPARPVLEPAVSHSPAKDQISREFASAGRAALHGDADGATRHLNRAGQAAVTGVQNWFTDPRNGWPPLAPATAKRKGSEQPLIDTASMYKAITYLVKEG